MSERKDENYPDEEEIEQSQLEYGKQNDQNQQGGLGQDKQDKEGHNNRPGYNQDKDRDR